MPLFGSRRDPSPEVYAPELGERKHGIFHRQDDAVQNSPMSEPPARKHSLFRRRDGSPVNRTVSGRSSTPSSSPSGNYHRRRGLLSKAMGRHDDADPSILQARERVMSAEEAEEQADRALDQARLRVREARDHMKRVEEEAAEEARRAKIKQAHAREVAKRGKGLGRHM